MEFPNIMDRGRNRYIDLLRAAAICSVLLMHWAYSGLLRLGSSTVDQVTSYVASQGLNGVLLFYVISGFVITRAAIARETDLFALSYRTFYPRRFARIYPLLVAVLIIGIGLLEFSRPLTPLYQVVVRNPPAKFDAMLWASIGTFTFNIWRIANLHVAAGWGLHWDVLWSLAVEEQFYIAFPLLLFLSKNRNRLFLILWSIILLSAGYRLAQPWSYLPYDSLVCFELIAAGVVAAVYVPRISQPRRAPLAMFGVGMLCAGFLSPPYTLLYMFKQEFIAIGAGALLCCAASAQRNPSILILPIAFVGELSYGMYLLHPVMLYAIGETIRAFGPLPGYVLFVAATTGIAALSYRYFEKPSERFFRGLFTTLAVAPRDGPVVGALDMHNHRPKRPITAAMKPETGVSDLIPLTPEEAISDLMSALAVIKPRIQIGRGKKLPDESERDRRFAAELIVRYYKQCGIRLFRGRPLEAHGSAHFLRPEHD